MDTTKAVGIIFYRDYYDNNELIWKANKTYEIVAVNLEQRHYTCKTESGEIMGMDIINNNRYALIYDKQCL